MNLDFLGNLAEFLVQAKRETYASQSWGAFVQLVLNGSKQLEYESGDYFYRDIYFGTRFFGGQEVVEYQNSPVWCMVYSGGVTVPSPPGELIEVYGFLRKALMLVDRKTLYRGPDSFQYGRFSYTNKYEGTIQKFRGLEAIEISDRMVYELQYSGGTIK